MKTMKKFDCKATWEDIDELVRGAEIGTVIKMSFDAYDFENIDAAPRHIDIEYKKVASERLDGDYAWDAYCDGYGRVASGEGDWYVRRELMYEGVDMARFSDGDGFYETEEPVKNFEITVA